MIKRNMPKVKTPIFFFLGGIFGLLVLFIAIVVRFGKTYQNRVYPNVMAGNINLSGKTTSEINEVFDEYNKQFSNLSLTISVENYTATISAEKLALGIDGKFAAVQGFSMGRSGNFLSDVFFKTRSLIADTLGNNVPLVMLSKVVSYNADVVDETVQMLASYVSYDPIEPLFELNKKTSKVVNFRLGKDGKTLDTIAAQSEIKKQLENRALGETNGSYLNITLITQVVPPKVRFNEAENLGLTTLLGRGESFYRGSIKERIHNLTLASSILHGKLIAPNETFSFNESVGDISAATGYKSAYIIKNGRTVLGDGGGVCQVSTTLFRAVLNAGLPIVTRTAHSYRVHYYEDGGFKPGLDATVFAPSTDFKFTNDTAGYILIQLINQPELSKLTFELYGTSDGRTAEIGNFKMYNQTLPPPAIYQDDPTLPVGVVKQVEWPAWGAKTSFDYKVTRNGETLFEKTFYSNYQSWQAVYLRGTKVN